MRRVPLTWILIATCGLVVLAGAAGAGESSDFGVSALQRAKESYASGDSAAARRHVGEATAVLVTAAEHMQSPGSGEVWMLVNDLRLLRLAPGDENPVTLHRLSDAGTRASALAERYSEGVGLPVEVRQ